MLPLGHAADGVDGNGAVFALLDGLFLLDWAVNDGPEPGCNDAADVDDNGVVFALLDALALLDWAFGDAEVPAERSADSAE